MSGMVRVVWFDCNVGNGESSVVLTGVLGMVRVVWFDWCVGNGKSSVVWLVCWEW